MIPRLPSNCEGVDKLLAGGIEQGTVSLVYGEAGTGKTSLALQLSREAIKAYPDHVVLFVDTEGLSLERMSQIFGDSDASKLLMIRPSSLTDLHQTLTKKLEKHPKISLIVVDTGSHQLGGAQEGVLEPVEAHGMKIMSMGFLATKDTPVVWRGPIASQLVQQFLGAVDWGELDYLFVDMPPGTGDIQLTLSQSVPLTGAVIVTTPQEIAHTIAEKGLRLSLIHI